MAIDQWTLNENYKLPPLQDPKEFDAFVNILIEGGAKSYLEIGSMWGRSLWRVATTLPPGSRVVAVDSMVDRSEAHKSLCDCIAKLISIGYDAHFIFGDSTDRTTIEKVKELGPFDAMFIDGNHSEQYVQADWDNYGPVARIVGFHDINWNNTWQSARGNTPPADGSTMGAKKVWDRVKQSYRFKEFKFHPAQNYYGIGVLWTN